MSYISHTPEEKIQMLETIGVGSDEVEELFSVIPSELKARSFDLPPGRSEFEVVKNFPTEHELRKAFETYADDAAYQEHEGLRRWVFTAALRRCSEA